MTNKERNGSNKPKQTPKRATKAKPTSSDKAQKSPADAPRDVSTQDDASKNQSAHTSAQDDLSVGDIARESKISPKVLRGKARKAGLHASGTKWPRFERDSKDHKALVALIEEG